MLVVAPKRVAEEVWAAETALWRPDLTCVVAKGTPAQRAAVLASDADIVAIGRDNLKDALTVKRPWRTLVLDELSGFKTKTSLRWKTAHKLIKLRKITHVWGLTGTPSPNGFMDLWAQVGLLDDGERLGKSLGAYRERWWRPGRRLPGSHVVIDWHLLPGAEDEIKAAIEDICLAMATDGRVKLPDTTFNDITVTLPPKIMAQYRQFQDDLVVNLEDLFGRDTTHSAVNAAVLTARLSQLTAGFMYVDDAALHANAYTEVHDVKVQALKEIMEAATSPVLVFYQYAAELEMIQRAFPDSWTVKDRDVFAKWNRGEVPMLLAHPASAGHGLNLQHGGHTIVWTTPTWNYEYYAQANKRLARQGQKYPVVIHHLLAANTLDRQILQRLKGKHDTQADLLAWLESPI